MFAYVQKCAVDLLILAYPSLSARFLWAVYFLQGEFEEPVQDGMHDLWS
jgi:hypothetical protein